MRGNPKNQAGQIFRAIDRIGKSRHTAKTDAMKKGAKGTHEIAKHMGVHSYSTLTLYRKVTTEFLSWLKETHRINDAAKIQPAHIETWLQEKIDDGCKYKTFSTYTAALQKASVGLSTIYKKEFNWSAPIKNVREQAKQLTSNEVKPRAYQQPEQILSHLEGHFKLAASLQLYSGCRVNEISNLTAKNIVGNNQIKLTNTKGGRIRTVNVPPDIFEKVARIINDNGSFSFRYMSYGRSLKEAAYRTQQPYNGSHGLRWNYAQNRYKQLQRRGTSYKDSLKTVSNELGHNRTSITLHYLQ